jgi:hypothetical protein
LKHEVTEGRSSTGNLKSNKKILLVSSHGRGIEQMLQETLGYKFEVCSIFNPNAPLAKVVEVLGKLAFPSKIILLEWEGQKIACIGIVMQLRRISSSL